MKTFSRLRNDEKSIDFRVCNRVMVYGTLRRGMHNHDTFLKGAISLGQFLVPGFIMWTNSGSFIPYVTPGHQHIQVEAYELKSPEMLRQLDCLEGHPDFYLRSMIYHNDVSYWIYIIPQDKAIKLFRSSGINIIPDGDYVQWRHDNKGFK